MIHNNTSVSKKIKSLLNHIIILFSDFYTVTYNALPDDGPVRPEICMS